MSRKQGNNVVSPPVKRSLSKRRLWLFRFLALMIPVVFFLLLEGGLRLAGTGYSSEFLVPCEERPGYVVDNHKFSYRFFPKSLARTAQPIVVSKVKPKGARRIIVFGGSAAMGDPEPAYGFPRVLEVLLQRRFPNERFEIVNTAMTAINSHVVLQQARDCKDLDADVWLIYLGNNEVHGPYGAGTVFSRKNDPWWMTRASLAVQETKTGQAIAGLLSSNSNGPPKEWAGLEMFLDQQITFDDPAMRKVYASYLRNLRDIVKLAESNGVIPIVSSVVTNLQDFSPLLSVHAYELSDDQTAAWELAFDEGRNAQRNDDHESALAYFEKAIEIDDTYAELRYRQAECQLALGRAKEARESFVAARDLDALRFRADSRINELAAVSYGKFIDAERDLADQSPDHIFGEDLLHEHVHLNFTGSYRVARMFAISVAEALELKVDSTAWASEPECAEELGLSLFFRRRTLVEMLNRLRQPPFSEQFDHAERDARLRKEIEELGRMLTADERQRTLALCKQTVERRPEDWFVRSQYALLLDSLGDLPAVAEQFEKVTALVPHHAESHFRLGTVRSRMKDYASAEKSLRKALELRSDFSLARNSLGICLSHLGKFEESYEQFRLATELKPNYAEAYHNWGLVLDDQGNAVDARKKYYRALAANENYGPSHVKLGGGLMKENQLAKALTHYEAVARLRPRDTLAQQNLGLLYMRLEKPSKAKSQFQRVLEIDPGNSIAKQALQKLN